MKQEKYQPTIGMEVHVELATQSKMFCSCPANHFRIKPNTHTCPVCLGLPGALPVPNKKAIDWTLMIGLALNSQVSLESKFDRKHYFYPDLPKGYQISQYDEPFCTGGDLETSKGQVGITRVHLEEDTGKLVHKKIKGKNVSLVDFNRCGVPLVEIVTEPDIHSAKQAKEFTKTLQTIIRYLGASDCDMEKGSMRLEANISLGKDLGYKVEIKNLNSFRFLEKAIIYEINRQEKMLQSGKTPTQETRGWDEKRQQTLSQRGKETAEDYRYFPEPDIPPLKFKKEQIDSIKKSLPELPTTKAKRFTSEFNIRPDYALVLVSQQETAIKAENLFKLAQKEKLAPQKVASDIVNKKISIKTKTPTQIVKALKAKQQSQVSDQNQLTSWVEEAIKFLPKAAKDYQSGKNSAIGALMGKIMGLSQGKADPQAVKKILQDKLK